MLLTTILTLTTLVSPGTSCAAIDNTANVAAFTDRQGAIHVTGYSDMDRIRYAAAPAPTDNRAWRALHAAEARLTTNLDGSPAAVGPKVRIACRR